MRPTDFFSDQELSAFDESMSFAYIYLIKRIHQLSAIQANLKQCYPISKESLGEAQKGFNALRNEYLKINQIKNQLVDIESFMLFEKLNLLENRRKDFDKNYTKVGGKFGTRLDRLTADALNRDLFQAITILNDLLDFLRKIRLVSKENLN